MGTFSTIINQITVKLSDAYVITYKMNDDSSTLYNCIGFTLPTYKFKNEVIKFGNRSKAFLIPDYSSLEDLQVTLFETENCDALKFINKCMNVNGSSEHNGTISSYNPFSSIYSITVDVYNNQLTKLKASFSFTNCKLVSYSRDFQFSYKDSSLPTYTISFSYEGYKKTYNDFGTESSNSSDIFDDNRYNISGYNNTIVKTEDLSNRSAVNTFDVVPYGARENGIFNYVDPLDQQSNAGKYGAKGVTDSEAIKAFKPFDTQTYKQGTAGTKSVDCHQFVEEGLNKLNFIWVDKNGNNITKKIQQLNTTQINTLAAEGDLFIQDKTGQNRSIDVAVTTGHIKILVKNEEGKTVTYESSPGGITAYQQDWNTSGYNPNNDNGVRRTVDKKLDTYGDSYRIIKMKNDTANSSTSYYLTRQTDSTTQNTTNPSSSNSFNEVSPMNQLSIWSISEKSKSSNS